MKESTWLCSVRRIVILLVIILKEKNILKILSLKQPALTKQERNLASKQLSVPKTGNHKQGSPRGQGHSQRSRPVNPNLDLVREASFVSDSASSGYYSESQHGGESIDRHHPHRESLHSELSERHHPYRESITSASSQRDFSAFVTQSDRERISNRGRDMTVYMYVLGGKESRSQNVTIKPHQHVETTHLLERRKAPSY